MFDKIHGSSLDVWKWEMYLLTRDFDNKPLLPPPLVIFEDIFLIAKMACKKAMNKSKKNRKKKNQCSMAFNFNE